MENINTQPYPNMCRNGTVYDTLSDKIFKLEPQIYLLVVHILDSHFLLKEPVIFPLIFFTICFQVSSFFKCLFE